MNSGCGLSVLTLPLRAGVSANVFIVASFQEFRKCDDFEDDIQHRISLALSSFPFFTPP